MACALMHVRKRKYAHTDIRMHIPTYRHTYMWTTYMSHVYIFFYARFFEGLKSNESRLGAQFVSVGDPRTSLSSSSNDDCDRPLLHTMTGF